MEGARGFLDRDFIEDHGGMLFCVIGNVHPPDRVIAYLKYVPGLVEKAYRVKWARHGVVYGRVLPYYSAEGVSRVMEFLEEARPEYVVEDPVLGFKLIEVPVDAVKTHYRPEERLRRVLEEGSRDPLEEMLVELVTTLSDRSGVPVESMGVSGSILLGIHNVKYSDIDLVVYGREESLRVKEALLELYSDESSGFSMPRGEVLKAWAEDVTRIHPLTLDEALVLYGKEKWNRALYRGRQFSVHPVMRPGEAYERYGDRVFRGVGMVRARVRVVDDTYSLFLPAVYLVEDARILEGPRVEEVREVTCYEGLYCDLARPGEEVEVYGKLERVEDRRRGEEYYRIVVGCFEARGRDYFKPLRWLKAA